MEVPTLLGYLARFGSFSTQSEVLCTQGLTYVLQTHQAARSALAAEVAARAGITIGSGLRWHAEVIQADLNRVDLEARAEGDLPVVKIEAKLAAKLTAKQLRSYAADLERNQGETALLVLVPKGRTEEAADVAAEALKPELSEQYSSRCAYRCAVAVISWEDLFAVLRVRESERLCHEVEQLQAMYRVLSGDYIAPLANMEELLRWRARETDFRNLVDQVTRRLTTQHQVYPIGLEPLAGATPEQESSGYYRRYVCSTNGAVASCFSIGVRDSFANWVTPVWMRFLHKTPYFKQISQRIEASPIRSLRSGGDLWIPLDVPLDSAQEQIIEALIEQAENVLRLAYPSPGASPSPPAAEARIPAPV